MFDFAQARMNMVDSQIRPNAITDSRIIDAMTLVRREDFVPEAQRSLAYRDGDILLTETEGPRYLIGPMAFARMVQLAEVRESDRVLDVGCATGYGAAVLSNLAGHVVALESDATLVALARTNLQNTVNVSLSDGPLANGDATRGPYDVILIEGRVEAVPEALFSQLTSTGRIIAAYGNHDVSKCCIWSGAGASRTQRSAFDISIASLPSFKKPVVKFAF